ncbi:M15 family metallopeptidase [Nocardioides dongkuii]|uniref:M15 family metallopeptidase n=1 Tax=Nocardioides dongkuii TaxID=2760089 RepID=UPI0015FC7077|nr:M15 family metallopeptidase [Nocardioides dongkuii]
MILGRHLFLVLLGLVVAVGGLAAPASAATPTVLTLAAPGAYADATTTLALDLRTSTGEPVAGAPVTVERRVAGEWRPVTALTTDAAGHATASVPVSRTPQDNAFRASYAGDTTYAPATGAIDVPVVRRAATVRLQAPKKVVDEQEVTLAVRWATDQGTPVSGTVRLQSRDEGQRRWRRVGSLVTDAEGRAELPVRPRVDTEWRAKVPATAWTRAATSPVRRIDNRPPRTPVTLPAGAPRPRVRLPRQERAVGEGAHVAITAIPDGVWRRMTGRSWRAGCPVGRAGLRLVRVNYWGYDGYRYRGELVAATDAADNMAGALAEMYRRGFPIRAMHRVDRFGWSKRLQGADDYASMAAGNTSAFNCRSVVGRPGVRSPHSYGRALDVNTWENPYHASHGVVPNRYWVSRSHARVAWRSRSHAVVRLMARHGLRWTYGTHDSHHFDVVGGSGRAAARISPRELHPQCDGFVCE